MERIRPHKWSHGNMVKRSVSWLYIIRVKCVGCVGQCRVASHLDPRECTSLRFKLSTDNFIHEMYFEMSSYEYGHAPTVLCRTNGPGNADKTVAERQSQLQVPIVAYVHNNPTPILRHAII